MRTILPMRVGDRWRVDVPDDVEGVVVRLRRRWGNEGRPSLVARRVHERRASG